MQKRAKTYLGDGAHAEFDGFAWTVSAERSNGLNYVVLGDSELRSFIKFVEETANVKITIERVDDETI